VHLASILQNIARHYTFHVFHALFMKQGYRIETNAGPKFVSIWNDFDLLEWSFHWREQLANDGIRQVDRFIRARSGMPYVTLFEGQYMVVQDIYDANPLRLEEDKMFEKLGHQLGYLITACKRIRHQSAANDYIQSIKRYSQPHINQMKRGIAAIKEASLQGILSLHWPSVEKRWKRAEALLNHLKLQHKKSDLAYGWAVPHITLTDYKIFEQGYWGLAPGKSPAICHASLLAQLLLQLWLDNQGNTTRMKLFLEACETAYTFSSTDRLVTLAELIYPSHLLQTIQAALEPNDQQEKFVSVWMEACSQQEKLDQLYEWFARRVDQYREERLSV